MIDANAAPTPVPAAGRDSGAGARSQRAEAKDEQDAIMKTYRYLRAGLVAVVALLVVALTKHALEHRCLQTSISGYYYTPVRAVFVGFLMALGFGLIVLRGHHGPEDILLNVAGLLAPVVAIMPTTDVGTCGLTVPTPPPMTNGKLADWIVANVNNNLWTLLITGLASVVATWVIGSIIAKTQRPATGSREVDRVLTSATGRSLLIAAALLVGAMLLYGFAPDWTRRHAHGWSALAMFVVLGIVATLNAQEKYTASRRYRQLYGTIAVLMLVVALFCFVALRNLDHKVLVLEASEIALFATYWALQTAEHWNDVTPRATGAKVDATTSLLAQGAAGAG
jgi:hypothetical protein